LVARAQQRAVPIVGLLDDVSFDAQVDQIAAFRQGLKETGFVEGQSLSIEYRSAEGEAERLPELAAQLVRRQVAAIVAIGTGGSARAAKAATSIIPIVFVNGVDPIETGLVTSLNRPEANVTGVSIFSRQTVSKRLDLLRELVPQAVLIGYLGNSSLSVSTAAQVKDLMSAAAAIGRKIVVFDAGTEQQIDGAFEAMAKQQVAALVVSNDAYLNSKRDQVVLLARRYKLPAIYFQRATVMKGGLISYGALIDDSWRQAGVYAGRILKGEKPANLPVLLPTRFELVINLKTAQTLGLTIPETLLATADEVIQ
jgi:putative ABC transport system substrate-binding protein